MKKMICKMAILCTALAILAYGAVFAWVSVCALKERTAQACDCLIVLGARVYSDGSMSKTLRSRCEAALQAWQDGIAQNIIVAGGQGSDEPAAEAAVMRAFFLENGVPEENVVEENASVNTIQNLENAEKIMRERGWQRAAVVTSDYHVQRALWIARDVQIEAEGIAAPTSKRLSAHLRESASWIVYALRRWLL